jgi:hypothetical protein
MKKAPALLYILSVIFLLTALVHFLALVMVFRSWNWLRVFEISPGVELLVFKNLLFVLGFLLSGISLLLRKYWSTWLGGVMSILLAAWFWLDRTLLNLSPLPLPQQLFPLAASLILLSVILISLYLVDPYLKRVSVCPDKKVENDEEKN